MDDEDIALFKDWKKAKQEKRARNRENSASLLRASGISFTTKNGIHLVVEDRYDFWPGTGHIKDRQTGQRHRGVRTLLRLCKERDELRTIGS